MSAVPPPGLPWTWGATEEERHRPLPCDELVEVPLAGMIRAVDVDAPAPVIFRWLCQIKVAPYSYDLIDNLGRRSPRTLTPGADRLARGQRIAVGGEIDSFEPDRHITLRWVRGGRRLFGDMAITWAIAQGDVAQHRLIGKVTVGGAADTRARRLRLSALAWGDLPMMRKQLLTLRDLAESGPGAGISGLH